jgi:hypothetical protein
MTLNVIVVFFAFDDFPDLFGQDDESKTGHEAIKTIETHPGLPWELNVPVIEKIGKGYQ